VSAAAAAVGAPARSRAAIVAGLLLGGALTWNIANTGAVAGRLSDAYGVSLAGVGLLTTALFATHLVAQLPAGVVADRIGSRRVALVAVVCILAGNGLLLATDAYGAALAARALVGIGTGTGFVAGLDLIRGGGGGPLAQGLFGGVTTASAGLALMVVPALAAAVGWRAPYWSAAAYALVAAAVVAATGPSARTSGRRARVLADLKLVPLAVIHAATFGLNVVAGNWIVTLLERQGIGTTTAGLAGGTILLVGIVSRPAGGLVVARGLHRAVTGWSLVAAGTAALLLAVGVPAGVAALAAIVFGIAAGLPWTGLYVAAQRLRPDGPAAAIAFVNVAASFVILVGTPLVGLTFDELPGDGRIGFAAVGGLVLAALLAWRVAALPTADGVERR
jgi:predicted MFS family arabinose efflux permease